MSTVQAVSNFTIYFADGHVGMFVAQSSLAACVQARKYHSAEVVYTTEGIELKYQYNGYGWDNLEAVNQRNNSLLAQCNRLVDAGVCTIEQFNKCCELYVHLIHASIVSIDGQWFIIDAVCDPMDYYHFSDMQFLESNAIHAHSYDQDGEVITVTWEDLINDLLDGGTELMRVQPMKIS